MEDRGRMTKEIYMKSLAERLRKLPKEDRETAMEYFQEYFEEAGPEQEAQAIESLGSPKEAADQIIMDLAVKNSEEESKKEGSFRTVWVGILAVFAAPIGIPLALGAVALLVGVGIMAASVIAGIAIAGLGAAAGGAVSAVLGAVMLIKSPANALATMGIGLLCVGAGLLLCPLALNLAKISMRALTKVFGNIVRRFTGKKGEK